MRISLPTYIDLYDELLAKGYEGKCGESIHEECCPFGLRLQVLILREVPAQENLEKEKDLERELMWMLEQDKIEVFKAFFDGAFWAVPFRHAADLITQDGLDTFVAYLRNCLSLGDVNSVLQKMRNDAKYTEYAFDADKKTIANGAKKRNPSSKKRVVPPSGQQSRGPGKGM